MIFCNNKRNNVTSKPTLFLGGDEKEWGDGENPNISFEKAEGEAFVASIPNADHTLAPTVGIGVGANRSYLRGTAAWLRCYLDGDSSACNLFTSNKICDRDFTKCRSKGLGSVPDIGPQESGSSFPEISPSSPDSSTPSEECTQQDINWCTGVGSWDPNCRTKCPNIKPKTISSPQCRQIDISWCTGIGFLDPNCEKRCPELSKN